MPPAEKGPLVNSGGKGDEKVRKDSDKGKEGGLRKIELKEPVGFVALPGQYVNRAIKSGFVFNMLVVGSTGCGKSTLIDSLFNAKFPDRPTKHHNLPDVSLEVQQHELIEKSVKLRLRVVETKGFGDQIDKTKTHDSIIQYVDSQFERYLQEELKIQRSTNLALEDTRIHVCIYMIQPTGHGLKAIDLVTMKELDKRVNLVPIIAKADTISKTELQRFRERIIYELNTNGINIYHFPTDDPEVAALNENMNKLLPFAIVASRDIVRVGNKQIRARQYPWGTVQIENTGHCDFLHLRDMILRVNLEDLREATHTRHYELYRTKRLEQMGFGGVGDQPAKSLTFQEAYEVRRQAHNEELKRREDEMRQAFVQKVKEKEAELKEDERNLHAKFEALKRQHAEEKRRLEDDKRRLEEEVAELQRQKQRLYQMNPHMTQSTASLSSNLTLGKSKKK